MSLDKSLRSHGLLRRHRSVLKREERIDRLETQERWSEDQSVLGLPKVRNLRVKRTRARQEKPAAEAAAEAAPQAPEGAAPAGTEAAPQGPSSR